MFHTRIIVPRQVLELPEGRIERLWQFERLLVWVRWFAAGACVVLVPFIPTVRREWIATLVVSFALSNVLVCRLLTNEPSNRRLRQIQRIATAGSWLTVAATMVLSTGRITLVLPAIYLILIVVASVRFRLFGAAIATIGASLLTGTSFSAQSAFFSNVPAISAAVFGVFWLVLFALMGAVVGILLWQSDEARLRRRQHRNEERSAYLREQNGLSQREWAVLQCFRDGLTYQETAVALHVTYNTIRSHVRNIGHKLGTSGRIDEVLERARVFGLLTSQNDGSNDETTPFYGRDETFHPDR